MARWTTWAASATAAAAAGAGLAIAHRRRSASAAAGLHPAPPPPPAPALPGDAQVPPAHAPVEDDPQAALDAARDRLRDQADALRREIEGSDGGAGGGG